MIDCLTNFFDELYNRHLSKKFLFVIDQKIQSLFGISIHEIGIKISNSNIYFMKNMTSKLALIIVLQLLFCKSSVQHLCMYLYLNICKKCSGTDTCTSAFYKINVRVWNFNHNWAKYFLRLHSNCQCLKQTRPFYAKINFGPTRLGCSSSVLSVGSWITWLITSCDKVNSC